MHTLTHTHPHVIPTTRMYTAGKSIYFIYYYYYYFPRALSVKRYRLGNLFGRIYGEEEQSNCRLRLRRWRILTNKIIYIYYKGERRRAGACNGGIRCRCGWEEGAAHRPLRENAWAGSRRAYCIVPGIGSEDLINSTVRLIKRPSSTTAADCCSVYVERLRDSSLRHRRRRRVHIRTPPLCIVR